VIQYVRNKITIAFSNLEVERRKCY